MTVYCENCGRKHRFFVKGKTETITVKGITFKCFEYHAYCKFCGNQVYVPHINDWNVDERERNYRIIKELKEGKQ